MGPVYHGKRALSTYLRYINKLAYFLVVFGYLLLSLATLVTFPYFF